MKTTSLLFVLLVVFILSACKKDNDNPDPNIVQPTSFKLNKSTLSLAKGGREKLLIIITPIDATISNATWSISDQAIATIDKDGVIAAVSPGNTIVTLTVGDKSEQCTLEVVESPVTGLIMPGVKYPIATGATIMIQGSGFQIGNKIWLRKNDNSGVKSAQTDQDILATILEQTETYITFTSTATDGWYSLILDNATKQFNLGNIQIETPVIPEFAYDKSKIFWDDSHWRRLQLRGKVKEMTINNFKYKNNLKKGTVIYRFNQLGHLESFVSEDDSIIYKYDDKNRLTNISCYWLYTNGAKVLLHQTRDYSYGTHEMYYPLTTEWVFNSSSHYWGISSSDLENQEIWVKGLTGIRYENFVYPMISVGTYQFEISSNLIVVTVHSSSQTNSDFIPKKDIYTYNGSFPVKDEMWWDSGLTTDNLHLFGYYTYQFSSTGMPVKVSYSTPETTYGFEINYYGNTAFCLASNLLDSSSTGTYSASSEYDNNWNLIKYTSTGGYDDLYLINYVSYDKTGNWSVCNVNSNSDYGVWTVTRDISYW